MSASVVKLYEKNSSEGLIAHMIRKLTDEIKNLKHHTGFDINDHLIEMFTIRRQHKDYK